MEKERRGRGRSSGLRALPLSILVLLLIGALIGVMGSQSQSSQSHPQSQPELHPQGLILSPASPVSQGEVVGITAIIENTGEGVPSEFQVDFAYRPRGGELWTKFATVTIPGLRRGEQAQAKAKLDASELEPGVWEVRVRVDPENQVPELDEANNELATTLTVLPAKVRLPDLHPQGLEFDVEPPVIRGALVYLSAEVANIGEGPAGPFDVRFFYRRIDEEVETELDTVRFEEGLGVGERRATGEFKAVILDTQGLTPGIYLIKVVVDPPTLEHPQGEVEELNEGNNELTALFTVQALDLHPEGVSFSPARVAQGETITVSALIVKEGEVEVGGFNVAFLVEGRRFAQVSVPGMATWEREKAVSAKLDTAALELAPGVYRITVEVDPDDQVPELDEANNRLTVLLSVQPALPRLPELHPRSLKLNPASPVEAGRADKVVIISEVANTGKEAAERFTVAFAYRQAGRVRWIPLPCVAHCTVMDLEPGGTVQVKGELDLGRLAPATYEIRVLVDPEGQVEELDETNNELVTLFTLLPARKPDLLFVRVLFEPPTLEVRRGQDLRITAEIANLGDAPAGPFLVEFAYRRAGEEEFTVFVREELAGLEVGQHLTLEKILSTKGLRPGFYELRLSIDPDDRIDELDEGNNFFAGAGASTVGSSSPQSQQLFVRGPDLIPQNLRFLRPEVPPGEVARVGRGEPVELAVDVVNIGVEAAGGFRVCFSYRPAGQLEGLMIACESLPGLGAGVAATVAAELDTSGLAPGSYELVVEVDPPQPTRPYGQVEEEVEENNWISALLEVVLKPDLLLELLALEPPSPLIRGEEAQLTVEVCNAGEADTGPFHMELALCGQPRCEPEEFRPVVIKLLEGLAPGECVTLEEVLDTTGLEPGEYLLRVTADPFKQLDELDEANNSRITPLELLPRPDLELEEVTLEPPSPVPHGTVVKLIANLLNRGPGAAIRPFQVEFAYRWVDPQAQDLGEFMPFSTVVLPGLEPDQRTAAKAELDTSQLAPGVYELRVTVDPQDEIPETEEGNNQLLARLEVLPKGKVDLEALSLILKPYIAMSGDAVTVIAELANAGEVAVGSFQVGFLYKPWGGGREVRFATLTVPVMEAGERVRVSARLDTKGLAPGNYDIIVRVDPEDLVKEVDETNNQLTQVLTVI